MILPKMWFLVFIIFLLLLHTSTDSIDNNTNNNNNSYCDVDSLPNPLTLRSDKLTVLISGYSPSRIPLLSSLALSYSSHPSVSSVLILWFNPSPSSSSPLLSLSSSSSSSISVHLHSTSSLSARFLPRPQILTRSVLVCDDDIQIPAHSLSFAFRISASPPHRDSLIGFFARSHDLDLGLRSWIYTVHPDRYSIVLTKVMILKTEYLYKFSCGSGKGMEEARAVVERERNCEDILMNFVVAMETGAGPVLVEGRSGGVRDWGDPRNEKNSKNDDAVEGALSGRGDHRRKRGECIREFHRVMGEMPLRYSYGKVVVPEGGDQGLCRKEGKLVFCDRDR